MEVVVSLLTDIEEWYKEESYPPEYADFDAELVDDEDLSQARWGTHFRHVYARPNTGEFVAVEDVRPATEMQDWGDYGEPEIYEVKPRVVVIEKVVYDKVE